MERIHPFDSAIPENTDKNVSLKTKPRNFNQFTSNAQLCISLCCFYLLGNPIKCIELCDFNITEGRLVLMQEPITSECCQEMYSEDTLAKENKQIFYGKKEEPTTGQSVSPDCSDSQEMASEGLECAHREGALTREEGRKHSHFSVKQKRPCGQTGVCTCESRASRYTNSLIFCQHIEYLSGRLTGLLPLLRHY